MLYLLLVMWLLMHLSKHRVEAQNKILTKMATQCPDERHSQNFWQAWPFPGLLRRGGGRGGRPGLVRGSSPVLGHDNAGEPQEPGRGHQGNMVTIIIKMIWMSYFITAKLTHTSSVSKVKVALVAQGCKWSSPTPIDKRALGYVASRYFRG